MTALDWIFIAALALGIVLGLIKGFLKPLFSVLGLVVVTMGTSFLSPVVQGWMMNANMSDSVRSLVAVIISAFILLIACGVIFFILRKIITRKRSINVVNRLIGAVLGVVIVYLVFAIVFAWISGPMGEIAGLNEKFGEEVSSSWIATHLYVKNPFGKLVVDKMAEKMMEIIQNSNQEALAVAAKICQNKLLFNA